MARIGGAFPLPTAQLVEGGGAIALASGAMWYPPAGEYFIIMGANTNFEVWDPIAQQWRQVTASPDWSSIDGVNWRLRNVSGTVTSTTITGAGSGMTNGIGFAATGVTIIGTAAGGVAATFAAIIGGSVQAPTITQGGSGFLVAPLIVIDPPPAGGIQATAVATISVGAITAITMVNVGAGYTATPNFWIIPQTNQYQGGPAAGVAAGVIPPSGLVFPSNAVPGNQATGATGAQLTSNALIGSGTLTGIKIISFGSAMTSSPTLTVTAATGSAGTATSTVANTTPVTDTSFVQPRVQ